jgi:hypothetical protein
MELIWCGDAGAQQLVLLYGTLFRCPKTRYTARRNPSIDVVTVDHRERVEKAWLRKWNCARPAMWLKALRSRSRATG